MPCGHPVDVAAQGIDLAVMRDHAERMSQIPGRKGVGGEALVHEGEGAHHAWIPQVAEVFAHLVGQQHSLVNDGARGQRRNIKACALPLAELADHMLCGLADNEQFALEGVLVRSVFAAPDEYLANHRFDRLDAFTQGAVIDRHIAPGQQSLPLGFDFLGQYLFAGTARGRIARQEQHANPVFSRRRQLDVAPAHLVAQETVRNLDHDARTVTRQRISADRAAVSQIFQNLQALRNPLVTGLAFDMSDETNAAGIMFMARVVQPLPRRQRRIVHLALTSIIHETGDTPVPQRKFIQKGRECYLKLPPQGNLSTVQVSSIAKIRLCSRIA